MEGVTGSIPVAPTIHASLALRRARNVENIHPEERLRIGRLKIVPAVKIGERGSCRVAFLSKDPGRSSKPKNSSR